MYTTDPFNIMDLMTFSMLFIASLLPMPEYKREKVIFWSLATCFSWLRLLYAVGQ